MKKKNIAMYALLSALGLSFLGTGAVQAYGLWGFTDATPEEVATRQTAMFQQKAQMLGISVEDAKNAWADGMSIKQIAEDQGIAEEQMHARMKDAMSTQMKQHMQTLVEKGVITQAQADKRLQFIEQSSTERKFGRGMGIGMMGRGFRHGFGF